MLANISFAVIVFIGWIGSTCLHEFGHAIVAYWGGDTTVKDKGYLTLNPFRYTHITLSLVWPLVFLALGGIALPGAAVYINRRKLRNRFWESATSAAGPGMSALTALATVLLFRAISAWGLPEHLVLAVAFLGVLEIAATLLNFIPIPSLDGYGIIGPWLPARWQKKLQKVGKYGFIFVFAVLWLVPSGNRFFWAIVGAIGSLLRILSPGLAGAELYNFEATSQGLFVSVLLCLAILNRLLNGALFSSQQRQQRRDGPPAQAELVEVLAKVDEELAANPDDATIRYRRGAILWNLNRLQEAQDAFRKALELKPDYPEAAYWHGILLQRAGQAEAALASLELATQSPSAVQSEAWLERGRALNTLERFAEAIPAFDRVLAGDPKHAKALEQKSIALFYLGKYADCIEILDRLLAIDPEAADFTYHNKACCYARSDRPAEAIAMLQMLADRGKGDWLRGAKEDPDFASLRENATFVQLVATEVPANPRLQA